MGQETEFQLKPEQKFALKVFYEQAKSLTKEQAVELLVELKRQDYAKTNFWVHEIKNNNIG